MAVLNLTINGREIIPFTKRISCDLTQFQMEDAGFWAICDTDSYNDYIYFLNQTDLDAAKVWLTAKGYTFGADEDITPTVDVQAWLDLEEAKGTAGSKSKSEIYDSLKETFPEQICIDGRV